MNVESDQRNGGEPPSSSRLPKELKSTIPRNPLGPFSVRNLQRSIQLDSKSLKTFINEVASELRPECAPAALVLVRDGRIRELNLRFRGKDKATDVLSFAGPDADPELPSLDPYLGDVIISVDTASRQAERRGYTLERELRLLAIHGFLHLLGYDHVTDDGEMRRIEYRLRRRFGLTGRARTNKPARAHAKRRHA